MTLFSPPALLPTVKKNTSKAYYTFVQFTAGWVLLNVSFFFVSITSSLNVCAYVPIRAC